jgi:hypothetical protein
MAGHPSVRGLFQTTVGGFLGYFPSRPLPTKAETSINISELVEDIESKKPGMTCHQYERCMRTVDYLKNGAPSFQSSELPGCFIQNSASTIPNGREVTENIATWVREGYVTGPFESPPCPKGEPTNCSGTAWKGQAGFRRVFSKRRFLQLKC